MESYSDPTQPRQEPARPTAEEQHRGKATTAMVLSIIGLVLLVVPGLNIPGLVLSIIGFSMAVKNRKFAAACGVTENGNNTAAYVCGLIGVIVYGLLFVFLLLAVILFLVVGLTAISAIGPSIGDALSESLPAIRDAIEGALPAVESIITAFFGLL